MGKKMFSKEAKLGLLFGLLAIIVCTTAVILFWPKEELSPLEELGIESPSITGFRAASPEMSEIEQLIGDEKYDLALTHTEKALKNSDMVIEEFGSIPEMWDSEEEMLYEDELEHMRNSELRWAYIYLLVQAGRNKEARKELKLYLEEPRYCEHEEEARQLLIKLKK